MVLFGDASSLPVSDYITDSCKSRDEGLVVLGLCDGKVVDGEKGINDSAKSRAICRQRRR